MWRNIDSNKQIISKSSLLNLKVDGKEIVYTWLIKNFEVNNIGTGLKSPQFPTEVEKGNLWVLNLKTNTNHEEYLSLELNLAFDDKCKRQTYLTLSIVDKQEKDHFFVQKLFTVIMGDSDVRSFSNFVKKSSFNNKKNDLLNNGVLAIKCKLFYINKIDSSYFMKPEQSRLKNFESLFINKNLSDVVLLVGSQEFQAHKCILSAQSKVFSAMFEHDMLEKKRNIVKIDDIQPSVMEKLLQFLYSGKFEDHQNIDELLIAADKYEVEDLKVLCEEELFNSLTVDTAGTILTLADRYKAAELKKGALKFISLHGRSIDLNKLEVDVGKQSSILIDIIRELLH